MLIFALWGCAPQISQTVPAPLSVSVDHVAPMTETVRIGVYQVSLVDGLSFVEERYSEPLTDEQPYTLTIPSMPAEAHGDMGELSLITGDATALAVFIYDDTDESGYYEDGEEIFGVGWTLPFQVSTGAWYSLTLDASGGSALGQPDVEVVVADFTEPTGFPVAGSYDASVEAVVDQLAAAVGVPAEYIPLRAATLSAAEQAMWEAYPETGVVPEPLPGRPLDVTVRGGAWSGELAAAPDEKFVYRQFPVDGLGTVALEVPVLAVDGNTTGAFEPDLSGALSGVDVMIGQLCYGGAQIVAMYRPVPLSLEGALVTWMGFGAQTGWSLLTGLETGDIAPVPPEEFGSLSYTAAACAAQ